MKGPVLHASLYRALKLTFLTDVGKIVVDGEITPVLGSPIFLLGGDQEIPNIQFATRVPY